MSSYPKHLEYLIGYLKKLPGIGRRSAERLAFQLLNWSSHELKSLAYALSELSEKIQKCPICGCLKDNTCQFCNNPNRDSTKLCVVAFPKDVFAMEETKYFQGLYHVLGGLISPLEGTMPDTLSISSLVNRVRKEGFQELILALDPTLEGDATALYIKDQLSDLNIPICKLALGLPLGSALDFVDHGTLSRAFLGRGTF